MPPAVTQAPTVVDHAATTMPPATQHTGACADRFPCATWDLAANGTPRIATALHLDLAQVDRMTRLRSGFGHDYSQGTDEACRSLKHYFVFRRDVDWANVTVRAPASGVLVNVSTESNGLGAQVWLAPSDAPAFRFIHFHVVLDDGIAQGSRVASGQRIGRHVGNQTADDLAVLVNTPDGVRFLSYGDVLTDDAFAPFAARNVTRADLAIPREWRDAHPMTCDGERFTGGDTSRDWLELGLP